jgi:hypothetical protein
MKISNIGGQLFINDMEVLTVVFKDGSTMLFPNDDANDITLDGTNSSASVFGEGNQVYQGKNIIAAGSKISCNGNFRLGDG